MGTKTAGLRPRNAVNPEIVHAATTSPHGRRASSVKAPPTPCLRSGCMPGGWPVIRLPQAIAIGRILLRLYQTGAHFRGADPLRSAESPRLRSSIGLPPPRIARGAMPPASRCSVPCIESLRERHESHRGRALPRLPRRGPDGAAVTIGMGAAQPAWKPCLAASAPWPRPRPGGKRTLAAGRPLQRAQVRNPAGMSIRAGR
jgi:hypothetical protein